jgi:hypothetical protein
VLRAWAKGIAHGAWCTISIKRGCKRRVADCESAGKPNERKGIGQSAGSMGHRAECGEQRVWSRAPSAWGMGHGAEDVGQSAEKLGKASITPPHLRYKQCQKELEKKWLIGLIGLKVMIEYKR